MSDHKILLFTKTTGYRHASLPDGIALIEEFAARDGILIEHTEDESIFNSTDLTRFDAAVWLQVSGDVLTEEGRSAFDDYLRNGGGFAGIHGASDAEWSWPAYEDIVGGRFLYHPLGDLQRQTALVVPENAKHPSTEPIPEEWRWGDEWYAFKRNPRGQFEILLRIDESTYNPGDQPMGADHPVSWTGKYGNGRTWYSSLGHYSDSYTNCNFREHLWGGIVSVLRDK